MSSQGRLLRAWMSKPGQSAKWLERVHVGEKIVNLLLVQDLTESVHLGATVANNLSDPFVVGRKPADIKVRLPKNGLEAGSLLASGGVRLVATVAVGVIKPAPRSLLWVQPEFTIALASLRLTGKEGNEKHETGSDCEKPADEVGR